MQPALARGARASWVVAEFHDREGALRRLDENARRVHVELGWSAEERAITHWRSQPPTGAGQAAAHGSSVGVSERLVVAKWPGGSPVKSGRAAA